MKNRAHLRVLEGAGAPPGERVGAPPPPAPECAAPAPRALPPLAEPSEYLDEKQKAVWHELYAEHGHALTDEDRTLFAKLVGAEALYRHASAEVARVGTLIKSPSNYPIQNPYLAVVNKQNALITRLSSELGLTPAARVRGKKQGSSKPKKPARGASPFGDLRTLED